MLRKLCALSALPALFLRLLAPLMPPHVLLVLVRSSSPPQEPVPAMMIALQARMPLLIVSARYVQLVPTPHQALMCVLHAVLVAMLPPQVLVVVLFALQEPLG